MWKIPRGLLEGGLARQVREVACQSFANPQRFLARIEEITASDQESFDLLELKDGRGFQNHLAKPVEPSELLAIVSSRAGRTTATSE